MRDPYLYEDVPVLRNLLGIKDADKLERAEADITAFALADVDGVVAMLPFDFSRLIAIHKHVFGDIFDWAGSIRTISMAKGERVLGGDTVRYSQSNDVRRDADRVLREMNAADWSALDIHETAVKFAKLIAALWQCHPFREGNTRATITFATQFAEAHGFRMDKSLLRDSAAYVRDALAKASDGQYSEYDYLVKIFEDAILRG
ncbi:MAG: Fic family protein [Gracilibacteraceae bacterium]|jgi:cell filamentation protein|nr:Fic family protein [Gracilibacteraceae bacterium]